MNLYGTHSSATSLLYSRCRKEQCEQLHLLPYNLIVTKKKSYRLSSRVNGPYGRTRIRTRTRIRRVFPLATIVMCQMFTLHRSRLGSQSQWLHWESESESESESGNVKEPLHDDIFCRMRPLNFLNNDEQISLSNKRSARRFAYLYRLDTVKSNTVNSKLDLIRIFLPIYFATLLSFYV